MKVFCITCLHFRPEFGVIHNLGKCDSPENTSTEVSDDTWLHPGTPHTKFLSSPKDINSTNQCLWYKEDVRLTT